MRITTYTLKPDYIFRLQIINEQVIMENSTQQHEQITQTQQKSAPWPLIIFIILVIIGLAVAWQYTDEQAAEIKTETPKPVIEPIIEKVEDVNKTVNMETLPEPVLEDFVEQVAEVEPEVVIDPLPTLNASDDWLKIKLPEITWRKELLKLVVDEDMIRRFVVFTDNFSQGVVAYEHSPFVKPHDKFALQASDASLQDNHEIWQWDENATKRFSQYVELLRSVDSETLVAWYFEMKPLIDEAYSELGYGNDDFTHILQDAITRILDVELPDKSSMQLVRPSVMYQFEDPKLEALADSDKLLLRLGKDNLLVIKSVLLEIHEKIAQQENGVD